MEDSDKSVVRLVQPAPRMTDKVKDWIEKYNLGGQANIVDHIK